MTGELSRHQRRNKIRPAILADYLGVWESIDQVQRGGSRAGDRAPSRTRYASVRQHHPSGRTFSLLPSADRSNSRSCAPPKMPHYNTGNHVCAVLQQLIRHWPGFPRFYPKLSASSGGPRRVFRGWYGGYLGSVKSTHGPHKASQPVSRHQTIAISILIPISLQIDPPSSLRGHGRCVPAACEGTGMRPDDLHDFPSRHVRQPPNRRTFRLRYGNSPLASYT
jgi:hypothetical protein